MLRSLRLLVPLLLLALFAVARPAAAQIGGTTDIITGTVVGPGNVPVAGAHVEVTSAETGITRTKTTNDKGQYTLLFPDGGGQYTVTVRALGLAPRQFALTRQADEDRLVANVTMSPAATQLATVNVRARRPAARPDERPTPGSTGRQLSGEQLARLPVDPSDPNAVALLAPGVVAVSGTDTTAAGFSVAGQRPDQNSVTLDGISFASAIAVPQEAIRNTRVVTSTYDVARGQFTGGIVQTTTRGGTNDVAGSASYSLRDPHLQWADEAGDSVSTFTQAYTQRQISGGIGGPIVKDRLFYFGSAQLRRRTNPLQSLLAVDPTTLQRLGASPDSAHRFLDLLNDYGIPANVGGVPDDRLADNGSAIVRMDYQVGENHSLMVRGNLQGSLQQGSRTTALTVPSFGGEQTTRGGGAMASLSSVLGTFLNEARASYERDHNGGDPYVLLPDGRVVVRSYLDDTTLAVSSLQFGGNPGLPTSGTTRLVELTDELSWLGRPGHRFKLGALFDYSGFSTANSANRLGSFTFNSLADFAANTPSAFTRTLTPRVREGNAIA
ncbi:MAG TPA: carboxypeptidase-like regulatory domain-containing protein, partial [Gemmatimonadaceae bacterium]|nr:carboxypeptidase-like regulatory domain-containing protein [Gemmatimonadaceae bacterium]